MIGKFGSAVFRRREIEERRAGRQEEIVRAGRRNQSRKEQHQVNRQQFDRRERCGASNQMPSHGAQWDVDEQDEKQQPENRPERHLHAAQKMHVESRFDPAIESGQSAGQQQSQREGTSRDAWLARLQEQAFEYSIERCGIGRCDMSCRTFHKRPPTAPSLRRARCGSKQTLRATREADLPRRSPFITKRQETKTSRFAATNFARRTQRKSFSNRARM